MPPNNIQEHPPSSLNVHNVLAALFKHKKKILLLTAIGLVAGAAYYFFSTPIYQSNAALLVRYVLDRSIVDPVDANPGKSKNEAGAVIDAEVQILRSWDLAVQVAEALGPKRVLPDSAGEPTVNNAAGAIFSGLTVTTTKGSNIISVAYQNSHPQVTTLVLNELITRYFTKHLEVHRSAGAFDFVSEQSDQVRARLNQTEDALKALKNKAGLVALPASVAALGLEVSHLNEESNTAESELAEQRARVNDLIHASAAPGASPAGTTPVSSAQASEAGQFPAGTAQGGSSPAVEPSAGSSVEPEASPSKAPAVETEKYQALIARLAELRKLGLELNSKYTAANPLVSANQEQIDSLERDRKSAERKYPTLAATAVESKKGGVDLPTEKARLAGLEAKAASLRTRLIQLTEIAPQITDLKRNQELEEANYKYFKEALEKARVDEALDPSKMPNISAVQKPSPPARITTTRDKVALGLAVSGLALGMALALLKEMLLNHAVKRPSELEAQLRVPLMLSIPFGGANGTARLLPNSPNGNGSSPPKKRRDRRNLVPWDSGHFIRPYADAIRDRLGLYFELHDLTRKPKLLGVTAFSDGAGASTLAAGLAASLSEVGDGKVLLVDVKLGSRDVHPFFRGAPVTSLPAALEPEKEKEPAAENLYLATVGANAGGLAQLGLKRFFDMIPNINASDYDYIVFDMPPLTQISPTRGMAGFMDKMLLVVQAEADNREVVKRGYESLLAERNNVAVVLNKACTYLPKWIDSNRIV
ncbi:MAG: hypothetical protein H0X73_14720 [Chthoniobacterales bacterium]|nr:hypothetical protein [Chthoniobacterales bacterium]